MTPNLDEIRAALAENERLRNVTDRLHNEAMAKWATALGERDAWRACADQLAACFEQWMLQAAPVREALAEYERLKGDR